VTSAVETDVVVIGVGSVGSMASWQLAARGLHVVGIDRFMIPGPFSAYAGESRVFRMVYAEGGHYTPLLQRARDLWRELEAETGAELLRATGVVTIMDHDHPDHEALLRAGQERGLAYEVVTGDEARRRLPQHLVRDTDVALFDPEGGFVLSERAVFTAVRLAERHGPRSWAAGRYSVSSRASRGGRCGLTRKRSGHAGCWYRWVPAPGRCARRWERISPCFPRS
jgi:sarcosine oxidase